MAGLSIGKCDFLSTKRNGGRAIAGLPLGSGPELYILKSYLVYATMKTAERRDHRPDKGPALRMRAVMG